MTPRSMAPIHSMPTLWLKLSARHHSSARRTDSSSLVHTFKPSSSSSPAIPITPQARTLCWLRAVPGAGIFRVDLDRSRETGRISLLVLGDADHASFDNVTFVDDKDTILVTEDRGDTLHDQLNKLDSIWAYKLNQQHPERSIAARFVALGQDTIAGVVGEEDNEPTGLHMSEGDSSINGLIGTKVFKKGRARLFFTQQHGENNLFEVSPLD